MTSRFDRRLTTYALASAAHLVLCVVLIANRALPPDRFLLAGVLALPLLFAAGLFQADVAVNQRVSAGRRRHWQLVLLVVPWSMAVYWLRHVRPRLVAAR